MSDVHGELRTTRKASMVQNMIQKHRWKWKRTTRLELETSSTSPERYYTTHNCRNRIIRETGFVASACIGYANHPPRQLVVWGLTPHKIHSLVGCSSVIGMLRQLSSCQQFNHQMWARVATIFDVIV